MPPEHPNPGFHDPAAVLDGMLAAEDTMRFWLKLQQAYDLEAVERPADLADIDPLSAD